MLWLEKVRLVAFEFGLDEDGLNECVDGVATSIVDIPPGKSSPIHVTDSIGRFVSLCMLMQY